MKKTDLAYIAGIIDGEGTIALCPAQRGNSKPSFQLTVKVSNTNEWLIQWLHFSFGGSCYAKKIYGENDKQQWEWALWTVRASEFLKLIYPYLRLKKPQAELAIKFQGARRGRGHRLTEGEMAVMEAQKFLLTVLNKRGIAQIPISDKDRTKAEA